ncbi:hypothetical protein ACA910_022731 [Epithemia clementina (nom. ined.)]
MDEDDVVAIQAPVHKVDDDRLSISEDEDSGDEAMVAISDEPMSEDSKVEEEDFPSEDEFIEPVEDTLEAEEEQPPAPEAGAAPRYNLRTYRGRNYEHR